MSYSLKKILIIAGGTGGHIFPALSVAETLQKQGVLIEWMGTDIGMERQLVANRYPIYFLPIKALRGKNIVRKIITPFRLVRAIFLAMRAMQKINPDCVLGMGGYASGPGGVAAWLLRKPLIIHEQNAKAGLTNRLLSHIATVVLCAFPGAFSKNVIATVVGNPVRSAIQSTMYEKKYDGTHQKPRKILVLGGSQGALTLNQLVFQWLSQQTNPASFLIWHQTGQKDFEAMQKKYALFMSSVYRTTPFIEKMEEAYAWADIVICRSGALTVSEIAAVGLPSILIPYPYAADDHQYANALFLVNAGAAVVFRESELTPEKLGTTLNNLLSSSKQLQQMANQAKICARPEAVDKIISNLADPLRSF